MFLLGIPAPQARTSGVLILLIWRVSTLTQYWTWFGKTAYIHRRESILFRDRERITIQYMEEEDHFTQTQLPALFLCTCSCCHCSSSLSLYTLHILTLLLHFALSRMPINRQVWWLLFFNNSSCTWVDTFVNGGCNYHWQMVTLLLRVGCPIMANPNNHPLWHLYGQLSSCFFSTNLYLAALPSLPFRERLWPSLQVLAKPFNYQSHQSTPFLTQKDHYNQMVCHFTSEEC